jgi:cell wall-associated NlpC family hydrolase
MRLLAVFLLLLLAACASAPTSAPSSGAATRSARAVSATAADKAAAQAASLIGKPYKFGGATPASGFDCSGLVQYSFKRAGVQLPHNTDKQRLTSRHIGMADLRRGDLVFFDEEGKKSSHVGIYLGHGMFVHAPSSGKTVRSDRLESAYWKKHLSDVRRVAA